MIPGGYHCGMRIITLNVNGIRSASRRGLFPFLAKQKPAVVCLQETRALEHQLEGHIFYRMVDLRLTRDRSAAMMTSNGAIRR